MTDDNVTAYPLTWPQGWPRTPSNQRRYNSRFQTTFDRAKRDLQAELRKLGASNVVVSSWLAVKNDGMPYADQARRRIPDPGVAVYFRLKGRPMVIARDAYETPHDNLRSIGHAIAHLRGLERHGGGHMMERAFTGFVALEAPKTHWRDVLDAGQTVDLREVEQCYWHKAKQHQHDHDQMVEINLAIEQARKELRG